LHIGDDRDRFNGRFHGLVLRLLHRLHQFRLVKGLHKNEGFLRH